MLSFAAAKAVSFVPEEDARRWIAAGIGDARRRLGAVAAEPRVFTELPKGAPRPTNLDSLFDLMCAVQGQVGQRDVEFSLVELDGPRPAMPPGFVPLGNPEGQLLHTFSQGDEYIVLFVPAIFRMQELVLASLARELGRIAIHRVGGHTSDISPEDREADAEIAAVTLGMGVWVANGAYVFENACCGGGCGIDLSTVRAGLSMPEACFALALDSHAKGLSRRVVARHLASTQKAAFKANWKHCRADPPALATATSKLLAEPERSTRVHGT